MKLTCMTNSNGGYYYPPCHLLNLYGFRLLLECPLDLSALSVFSPLSNPLSPGLIASCPSYKTVAGLHLLDPSLIDAVLVSTPAAMLGLPFLTRDPDFKAKVYATEVTARVGRLWMEELVSTNVEFVRFYGPGGKQGFPGWKRWEELEKLSPKVKDVVVGEDGEELGSWMPLYSAVDIRDCMRQVRCLKYGEETCFNGAIILKAYSSGLEIGSCNWTIHCPNRSVSYLTNSIFESEYAMGFDYNSLRGNDVLIFSDSSFLSCLTYNIEEASEIKDGSALQDKDSVCSDSTVRDDNGDEIVRELSATDECSDEIDRINFICSSAVDSLTTGGSVLIPIGRLGTLLQLMEQISQQLDAAELKVPILFISDVGEEILALSNTVPEWLSKQRQSKLFMGESLFGHVELLKLKKLSVFSSAFSSELIMMWQEPCIVFCTHWSLRLGPVVHLLHRWRANPKCLLILEEEVDTEIALLPFRPLAIKVLQCSFLSGIMTKKVQPLLELLQPKVVLFPGDVASLVTVKEKYRKKFLHYHKNVRLKVPSFRENFEAYLGTDLAFQLQPKRLTERNIALARLKGKICLSNGKYFFVRAKNLANHSRKQVLHWGVADPVRMMDALKEKGFVGSLDMNEHAKNGLHTIYIADPAEAVIEISGNLTTICCRDGKAAALIYQVFGSVWDGV